MIFPNGDMTLDSITDEYMIQRMIRNRKYYAGYLTSSKWAWKQLFKNTIYSVQSEWQPLRKGDPYNYIDVPKGMQRLFSVSLTDHCGNIIPLEYANDINIIPQPKVNTCGCSGCTCDSGLCEDIGGLTKLTKLLFSISGVDYYEVTWLKLCPNGDILEYREVPTKKYNSYAGDGGDYNGDYNNDYLLANPPFTDYTIVTEKFQRVLCKLDLKPCGCPDNTTTNEEIFLQHCGAFCQPFANCRVNKNLCQKVYENTNYDQCLGRLKMSECGTRIYYIPKPIRRGEAPRKLPEYLLVNFQTSGENCSQMVIVPEYAVQAMFYGIDHVSKRFSGALNFKEKQAVKYEWVNAQNELILYLSNFNLDRLAQVQDIPIKF